MQLKPISQQVAVIFGASSGIGRETARQFAMRGAKVVVAARSEPGLQSLVDEIRHYGGEALAAPADTIEFGQVQSVAEQAITAYGRIDTWIHCAAVNVYATFEDTDPEEFKRIIDVNLTGMAYGAKVALPHLKRNGGALILISSIVGQVSLPYQSAYSASKHGINGMADALRLELKHQAAPVSVTTIMPGSINTPFFNKARTKIGVKPMGVPPFYEPEVVTDAILYAAEHPVRTILVGDSAKMFSASHRLSPQMTDAMLLGIGFSGQRTDEPKSEDAPYSLYAPVPEHDRVKGDFGNQALQHSVTNWFDYNPVVRDLAIGAAVTTLAYRGLRALFGGR